MSDDFGAIGEYGQEFADTLARKIDDAIERFPNASDEQKAAITREVSAQLDNFAVIYERRSNG